MSTKYVVYVETTLTANQSVFSLSMDYITNPVVDCKIYVNGSLKTYASDYTITNIVSYPYYTTFTLTLINEAVIGDIVRIEKNDEWNQWIQFKFPDLEARLLVLEGKVGTATSIASRLLATEVNLASAEADIVTLNGLVSGNSGDITNAKVDITNLQNAVVGLASRTSDLEAFMGIEGYATIDNGVVVAKEISELEVDGYAYTSVKIDYEIARQTGTEYRSTVGTMYLVCKSNGVWYTERGLQIIDMDGVTFTIATNAGKIGKVSYVSDTVSGGGYTGYFKFRLTKFEV